MSKDLYISFLPSGVYGLILAFIPLGVLYLQYPILKTAKKHGYWIEVVFVLTSDANINVSRVKSRVKKGGHDVPEDKIRSRYVKSLANLKELFKFCDVINVVDNSTDKAELIISLKDKEIKIYKSRNWTYDKIRKLIGSK